MAYLRRFVLMLQFLTTIPVRINIKAEREDFGKGLAMAPVVGLLIGVLLAVCNYLLGLVFPAGISAVFTVAFYIALTGGLHLDGLGDTADGLFSNRPKERILEIMKDSRVGTNAVLAVIIVILMYYTLISSLGGNAAIVLLLMPAAGRIGSLVGAGTSRYAGTSDGPGRWCVECCRRKDVILGLIIYFAIFTAVFFAVSGLIESGALESRITPSGITSGIPDGFSAASIHISIDNFIYLFFATSVIPPLSAFILARYFGKKIDGVTGDILGAVCELNQVIFLVAASILL